MWPSCRDEDGQYPRGGGGGGLVPGRSRFWSKGIISKQMQQIEGKIPEDKKKERKEK